MGECGCGTWDDLRQVVRSGNRILVTEVYHGCEYCNTGVAVSVHAISQADADAFMLEPSDDGWENLDIELMDAAALEKAVDGMPLIPPNLSLQDWMHDNGLELLGRAISIHRNARSCEGA